MASPQSPNVSAISGGNTSLHTYPGNIAMSPVEHSIPIDDPNPSFPQHEAFASYGATTHSPFIGGQESIQASNTNSFIVDTYQGGPTSDSGQQNSLFPDQNHPLLVNNRSKNNAVVIPSGIPLKSVAIIIGIFFLLALTFAILAKSPYGTTVDYCDGHYTIVESIPQNISLQIKSNTTTYQAWMELIGNSKKTLDIAAFYWTLTNGNDSLNGYMGKNVFTAITKAADRGVKIRIAQNSPSAEMPDEDSAQLAEHPNIKLVSLDFDTLLGDGVLHTKMLIADQDQKDSAFYVGSANLDWRSLAQVKELGIYMKGCSKMSNDLYKIFEIYWEIGSSDSVPVHYLDPVLTKYNLESPAVISVDKADAFAFFSSSPPEFSATGRTDDLQAALHAIDNAEEFVYLSVMDYVPALIYQDPVSYWPYIQNAFERAAFQRNVQVKLMISQWNHSYCPQFKFLEAIDQLDYIQVRLIRIPELTNATLEYARVSHSKYLVTDKASYITTSNWSGDYFVNTGGVTFNTDYGKIRADLEWTFDRDWYSQYTVSLSEWTQAGYTCWN